MPDKCSLCLSITQPFLSHLGPIHGREFVKCGTCGLVSVKPCFWLGTSDEKARYLSHHNSIDDPRYVEFLNRLLSPLKKKLDTNASGLDYGSGPSPVLSRLLEQEGHEVAIYDLFFHHDPSVLDEKYDFVTCTEVAEHFHYPAQDFGRIAKCLRSEGWFGLMTQLLLDFEGFPSWYYQRDPTHVCFYSPKTIHWIADRFGWEYEIVGNSVVLFKFNDNAPPVS